MSRDWTPEEIQAASTAMQKMGEVSYEEFCRELEAADAKRLGQHQDEEDGHEDKKKA